MEKADGEETRTKWRSAKDERKDERKKITQNEEVE